MQRPCRAGRLGCKFRIHGEQIRRSGMKTRKRVAAAERPRQKLGRLARERGCVLSSLGDVEQLAGIDIRSQEERTRLWNGFRHLYTGPTQVLFDAVMDHCASVALEKLERGELCLVETRWPHA